MSHPSSFTSTVASHAISITTLPPELLLLVLEFTMNPYQYHTERIFRTIAYSHVCRCWRSLLLGAPDFWTLLDLQFPTIAREFCVRSQDCPIRVSFIEAGSTHVSKDTLAWLSLHSRRIEGVYLATSQTVIRDILSLIQPASPFLGQFKDCLLPDDTHGPILSLDIHAHEVQRLNMDGFHAVNWPGLSERPTSLTSLVLTRFGERSYLPIPRLLSILSNCPKLQTLTLLSAFLPWPVGIANLLAVELPALQSLEVAHNTPGAVSKLLDRLSFPHTTSLTFHAHGTIDLSCLLPKNLARFGLAASSCIDDPPVTQLCRISPSNFMLTMHRPRTSSTIRFFIAPDDLPNIPSGSPSAMSMSMGTWKAALSSMPALRHIEVSGAWANDVLLSLMASTGPPALPFPPLFSHFETSCPALECLHVLERSRDDTQTQKLLDAILFTFKARHESLERKLPVLILETSRASARALMSAFAPRFAEVVERVDVRSRAAAPVSFDAAPMVLSRATQEAPASSPESKRRS
ncbi:uncharacterized protein B0H18DRAFT_1113747 [Fomitopsis serialis]|uniref:uncharacterized protein n=1 Tax=Fomitopsis serialis TaxID=139415 RepID=UPI00200778F7|nr:uncharacterized protein B0H18DRAFT_1113747 [Neoantrodia serialis]KAH9936343.1 hypothetical protein B0H18DRAFT_1113747 [Neoantrodia serialis]